LAIALQRLALEHLQRDGRDEARECLLELRDVLGRARRGAEAPEWIAKLADWTAEMLDVCDEVERGT
jgi:hypothetical protein